MKKSQSIKLGLVAAIALIACNDTEAKHCVSEDGTVVEDSKCEQAPPVTDGGTAAAHPFRWFYGGTGGRILSPGTKVPTNQGGGYHPSPGRSYSTPGTIGRGGFGGVGRGSPGT